jgi:hypothetical protein
MRHYAARWSERRPDAHKGKSDNLDTPAESPAREWPPLD